MTDPKLLTPGFRIFAKMKGYEWPARIDELQEGQHCPHGKFPIYFYGIHERACLDAKKVWEYEPNKEIFGTGQTNESFNEGLWEIENNPHVNFIGALEEDEASEDEQTKPKEQLSHLTLKVVPNDPQGSPQPPAEKRKINSQAETSAKKRNTNNSFNGQDEAFDEGRDPPHNSDQNSRARTKQTQKEKKAGRRKRINSKADKEVDLSKKGPNGGQKKTKAARKGRESSTKRVKKGNKAMATSPTSELEKEPRCIADWDTKDQERKKQVQQSDRGNFTRKHKREQQGIKKPKSKVERNQPDSAEELGVEMAVDMPSEVCQGSIKKETHSSGDSSKKDGAKQMEEHRPKGNTQQRRAQQLKKVERRKKASRNSKLKIRRLKKQKLKPKRRGGRTASEMLEQKNLLESRKKILAMEKDIKRSLQTKNIDVDKCIAVLDELIKLEVNSSLLPNNSGIVETIRKCRKFKKSEVVMRKAELIYKKLTAPKEADSTAYKSDKEKKPENARSFSKGNEEGQSEELKHSDVAVETTTDTNGSAGNPCSDTVESVGLAPLVITNVSVDSSNCRDTKNTQGQNVLNPLEKPSKLSDVVLEDNTRERKPEQTAADSLTTDDGFKMSGFVEKRNGTWYRYVVAVNGDPTEIKLSPEYQGIPTERVQMPKETDADVLPENSAGLESSEINTPGTD